MGGQKILIPSKGVGVGVGDANSSTNFLDPCSPVRQKLVLSPLLFMLALIGLKSLEKPLNFRGNPRKGLV